MYFQMEEIESISNHIMALYAAKLIAFTKQDASFDVNLEQETEQGAVYIHNSRPGISVIDGPNYERRIDERYLNGSRADGAFRLESYRSLGHVSSSIKAQLRCYFVARCEFVNARPEGAALYDIAQVSDRSFLSKATRNTLAVYAHVMRAVLARTGPVIEAHDLARGRERRIIVGYRQGSIDGFFASMSDLYHYYELYSTRKYVENFSNGVTIMTLYLAPLQAAPGDAARPSATLAALGISQSRRPALPLEHAIAQVLKEASLMYCVPQTPLQALFQTGQLSIQEAIYGHAALIFCQHFLNRLGSEYTSLLGLIDPANAQHMEVLLRLKKRLRQETFTRDYLLDIVRSYPDLIRLLYVHFAMVHYRSAHPGELRPSVSYQRIQKDRVLSPAELRERIKHAVCNPHELLVFSTFLHFNDSILRTNFYHPAKVALSFRLDPAFLPATEYPQRPFGIFLVIGGEFRGFHVRFQDVARGGIRIIRSRNREAYSINLRTLFDENYALAATQERKNKDIPEGGSKGTILLDAGAGAQEKARVAFEKYVDAILDLLLVNVDADANVDATVDATVDANVDVDTNGSASPSATASPNAQVIPSATATATATDVSTLAASVASTTLTTPTHPHVHPHTPLHTSTHSHPPSHTHTTEMLFFGPDEGTAEFMDWASTHARARGAPFWKAFATGKSQALGGIPHDLFGMTTRSIHQYVAGIYRKLGLEEEQVSKFQTGGPDGDLGSNEIKISRDRTVAVVDGSGVLYDPAGLDRAELLQLAQKRQMVCNFSTARLGRGGFRVLIDERNVTLPTGEHVDDGLRFRNEFHLHPLSTADLFVPCGGRPEAVDIHNVERLFAPGPDGKPLPRFRYIVEGANLFFTQDARLRLEAAGVIIFKDASANKGGVTSSSLEVLAALAFTDDEFARHMQVDAGVVPDFYNDYVRCVHAIIERNAALEFDCIWREHQRAPQRPWSVISDDLSLAILRLSADAQRSDALYGNVPLRRAVLARAFPPLLIQRLSLDLLLHRLPENYLRALFGSYLASRFVYHYGSQPSQFAFFEFMSRFCVVGGSGSGNGADGSVTDLADLDESL